jgi:hypothetical protein
MKKGLWVAILLVVWMSGTVWAKEYKVHKMAGDYMVDIMMDKDPPVVGANLVELAVTDKAGKVTDAKVQVVAQMPAMPGMPAMENKADAKLEGDRYQTKITLSMGGSWNMSARITRGGKTTTLKWTVDAR